MTVVHIVVERGLTRHSASIYLAPRAWISYSGQAHGSSALMRNLSGLGRERAKPSPGPQALLGESPSDQSHVQSVRKTQNFHVRRLTDECE